MVMKQLHPGAKWLFRITGFFSVLFLMIFFGVFFTSVIGAILISAGLSALAAILSLAGFLIVIVLLFLVEVYARLAYRFWKYEFLDDQLRLERGIIWKRYSNVPYQRMQNVDIHRGIIARLFGFSTVVIQTAGYSVPMNGRGISAEGYIPAVSKEEAEKIREFVVKKIAKRSGSGL